MRASPARPSRAAAAFDVCRSARPEHVFLYELYDDDRAAFDAHLAAAHFKAFDAAVKAMVASKAVHAYELASA
jgi:quinol monooxygenase YgiN